MIYRLAVKEHIYIINYIVSLLMSRKILTILLLLAIMTGTVSAQRGKRAIKRIDREVQEAVFIPKGTWMAGGTVSYSENEQTNLNFLILKDLEGKGYNFSVSPYVGYFFRNNIWNINILHQVFCEHICLLEEVKSLGYLMKPV